MPASEEYITAIDRDQFCAKDVRVLSAVENYQPVRSREIANSTKIQLDDVMTSLDKLEKMNLVFSQHPKECSVPSTVFKWSSVKDSEDKARIFKMIVSRKIKTEKIAMKAMKFVDPVKGSTASDIRRRISANRDETLDALGLLERKGMVRQVFSHKYRKGMPVFRYYVSKCDQ